MSTKIYDAYKVTGTIHELMRLLQGLRELHIDQSIANYKRFSRGFKEAEFKGIIEKDETLESLSENNLGEYILSDIIRKLIDRGQNTPLNISASAVVYFDKENIYVKFFGLSRLENGPIKNADYLQDYHYQNSVDQSNFDWDVEKWENMTPERQKELEEDWEERRETWDRIIGDGPFYEKGLVFDFVPAGYPMILMCKRILNKNPDKA